MKKLVLAAGIFVALVIVAFFVVTSGGFIKSVVLPKVGTALNADLTVGAVEFSPFSQLVLHDVKLTPNGKDTLLTASLVRARYSLLAVLGGNIAAEEITVESPTVTLVQNADGTSNLDPLLQGSGAKQEKSAPAAKSSAPPQIDVKTVALKNATVKVTRNLAGGGRQVIELANVNLNAANLKNGSSGKLDLAAAVAFNTTASNSTANVSAKLDGNFTFDLTPDLVPSKLNGQAALNVERAGGAFAELAALAIKLDADASPTEIKQLAVRFTQAGQALGEVRVNGPFDAAKTEGRLNVAILSLDRRVLNIAGAASGIDFGTTLVNSTNVIELSQAGSVITAAGQLDATRVQITQQGQTTPTLDLRCGYALTVNHAAQSAQIRELNLTGTQESRPLLQTELTSPMTIAWGNANSAVGDATLNVTLTRLNLADWRAFAPGVEPAGTVSATLKLLSQQAGKRLNFDLDANATELSARFGSNLLNQADVSVRLRGNGVDLKQFKLDEYVVALGQRGQSVARVSGSGTFDAATKDADLQIALQATVARVLGLFPQPDAEFSGGTVELTGRVGSKAQSQSVTGKFVLAGLTGKFGDMRFASFGSTADLDLGLKGDELEIRQAAGELHEGSNPGGTYGVAGNFDTVRKAGQFSLALTNFNQNGLRPFLESALGDKKLVSVALNTTATAKLEANGDAAVKANVHLANLVVNDPKGSLPTTPLEVKVALDAGVAKSVAQVRQCQLTLTPTTRARNELNLTGSVDYSRSNAIAGSLKLAADSLDVTRYYDLFAGDTKPTAKPTTQPTAPADNKEPEPVKLPFSNFSFEAIVGKFYLREVEATNFQFTAKLDGGHVLLNPAKLVLNGAPVSATADLDLGVPGYKYDIVFNANRIPIEPLVNSFFAERKGQIHGFAVANAQIKGAGITGANLQRNLTSQFSFACTNLNLKIEEIKGPWLLSIVDAVISIPEFLKNPLVTGERIVEGALSRILGTPSASRDGWSDKILQSPLQDLVARGSASNGKIEVPEVLVRGSAFEAKSSGDIGLAPILTNSTLRFPVSISLERSLADGIGLLPTGTPTNQIYIPLPDFFTLAGTIGKTKSRYSPLGLITLAGKTGGGLLKSISGAAGGTVSSLLNTLTGLAGGNQQPAAPATTNAAPATTTNAVPGQAVGDLLRGLGGLLGGQKPAQTTNNPPVNPK